MITLFLEDGRRFQFEDDEKVRLVKNNYRFTEVACVNAEDAGTGEWVFAPESVKNKDRHIDLGLIVAVSRSAGAP